MLGETLSEMMNMSDDKTKLYLETVQCATDVTERMIGEKSKFTDDLENFKSIFNLMKSNLNTCDVLSDIENQIMWVADTCPWIIVEVWTEKIINFVHFVAWSGVKIKQLRVYSKLTNR